MSKTDVSSKFYQFLIQTLIGDVAVFLTIFYKLLIGEKKTPWIAFRNSIVGLSQSLPKLSGAWSFYEWGEKCLIDTE